MSRLPEAAAESWREPDPLQPAGTKGDVEYFQNNLYDVSRRTLDDHVFGSGEMVMLGICSADGTARHDWRDFQWIKNTLVGPEVEAFELYPADSRLQDPSNYYMLWCFPKVKRIKVGRSERIVLTPENAIAPQRKML